MRRARREETRWESSLKSGGGPASSPGDRSPNVPVPPTVRALSPFFTGYAGAPRNGAHIGVCLRKAGERFATDGVERRAAPLERA